MISLVSVSLGIIPQSTVRPLEASYVHDDTMAVVETLTAENEVTQPREVANCTKAFTGLAKEWLSYPMSLSSDPSGSPVAALVAGGIFMAVGLPGLLRIRKLRRTGASAIGQVVAIRSDESDGGTPMYSPVVVWRTPDGRRHEYSPSEHSSSKRRFRVGTHLTIYYDPADPDRRPKLKGSVGNFLSWSATVAGAAVVCAGLVELVLTRR